MSDQTPSLSNVPVIDFSKVIVTGLPGIGGLLSLNGDSTPAQLLIAGAGISIVDAGASHTISATGGGGGIASINGDTTAAQILAAGAGITITPGPAGTNTIAATGGGGITTLNGDATAAQIVAGGGIVVVTDVGNTHTITVPGFAAGTAGVVNDPGAAPARWNLQADNTFALPQTTALLATGGAGTAVPNGALTVLCSFVVPAFANNTTWTIFASGGVLGVAGQFLDVVITVNGAVAPFAGAIGCTETAGQDRAATTHAPAVLLFTGDVVAVEVNHHGGGAGTTSTTSAVTALKST